MKLFILTLCLMAAICFLPNTTDAYIGPGAGLGMLGSLVAVIGMVLVAAFGLVIFPITIFRKWRRNRARKAAKPSDTKAETEY